MQTEAQHAAVQFDTPLPHGLVRLREVDLAAERHVHRPDFDSGALEVALQLTAARLDLPIVGHLLVQEQRRRAGFGPKGGRDGAMRFTNGLKMVAIVTHVADARSCVLHPASHTHRQLNDQQLIEAGVLPDLIRLSVGIEDVNDIIADLDQALANV